VIITNNIIVSKDDVFYQNILQWSKANLIIANPEYTKKARMGKWLGNTPKTITYFEMVGDILLLPYGCIDVFKQKGWLKNATVDVSDEPDIDFGTPRYELFDYQQKCVDAMLSVDNGVFISKAGSGKTMMLIDLIIKRKKKALVIVHTHDLLTQVKRRIEEFTDIKVGTITEGKINIQDITVATVQTLCKIDLTKYQYTWGTVVCDECHRICGNPTQVAMFYKVLSKLRCSGKFGCTATLHRADGLQIVANHLLGSVKYVVADEDVADKVMTVFVVKRPTHTPLSAECLDTDGTLLYQNLISYLGKNTRRNFLISNDLAANADHSCLILSDRIEHLKTLMSLLPQELCVMIDGTMTSKKKKEERQQALDDMRSGKKHYLFATYRLAKEGLDIPRLDRLFLTTPQKDYAIVTQAIGRISRIFKDKPDPICYDYVDDIAYLANAYKKRCSHYRKGGCQILGGVYDE